VIEVNKRIRRPKVFFDFFPGYELSRTLQKDGENLERLIRNTYSETIPPQFAGTQISLIFREGNNPD
jgi:hypothetical protein